MKQLKDSGADSLIGWTVGPEEGVISASRVAVGWNVPQLGPWGLSHASAFRKSGGQVEGALMVQTVLPNIFLERNSAFLRNYAKLSKEAPIGSMMSAAQTYDAVHLLLRAMFDSRNDLSSTALKSALEHPSNTYRGVVTTYERAFSPTDHDAISANMLWLGTWRKGERAYATRTTSAKDDHPALESKEPHGAARRYFSSRLDAPNTPRISRPTEPPPCGSPTWEARPGPVMARRVAGGAEQHIRQAAEHAPIRRRRLAVPPALPAAPAGCQAARPLSFW
jgi:hypothetical protein